VLVITTSFAQSSVNCRAFPEDCSLRHSAPWARLNFDIGRRRAGASALATDRSRALQQSPLFDSLRTLHERSMAIRRFAVLERHALRVDQTGLPQPQRWLESILRIVLSKGSICGDRNLTVLLVVRWRGWQRRGRNRYASCRPSGSWARMLRSYSMDVCIRGVPAPEKTGPGQKKQPVHQ